MQSRSGARTGCNDAQAVVVPAVLRHLELLRLRSEKPVLLGPAERQIEFGQTRRRKLDRSPALQDCFDQLWAQEGQTNKTPDIAPDRIAQDGCVVRRAAQAWSRHRAA